MKKIESNAFDYDAHIALIKYLRSVTDIEGLKNARMEFAALFPLGLGIRKSFYS